MSCHTQIPWKKNFLFHIFHRSKEKDIFITKADCFMAVDLLTWPYAWKIEDLRVVSSARFRLLRTWPCLLYQTGHWCELTQVLFWFDNIFFHDFNKNLWTSLTMGECPMPWACSHDSSLAKDEVSMVSNKYLSMFHLLKKVRVKK